MRFLLLLDNAAQSVRAQIETRFAIIAKMAFALLTPLIVTAPARAEIAVSVNSQGLPIAFVIADQSLGWRFTVNAPIELTSLGLLDANLDGFQTDHPMAVWDGEGNQLAEALVQAGTVNPLVNQFRYAPLLNQGPVILTPGDTYTIGYFTTGEATADSFVVWNGVHTMNPAINQVGAQFYTMGSSLMMPDTPNSLGSQCFGPNFQFNIVPGPGALSAIGLGWLCAGRWRRRRER